MCTYRSVAGQNQFDIVTTNLLGMTYQAHLVGLFISFVAIIWLSWESIFHMLNLQIIAYCKAQWFDNRWAFGIELWSLRYMLWV